MRGVRRPRAAAIVVGLLAAGGVVGARAADCDSYAVEGVRLGMTPKEVRKVMRGPAEKSESHGDGRTGVLRETYLRSPSQLEVTFDEGAAGSGREMLSVRLRFVPPADAMETFLGQLGEPDSGAEHRARGAVTGPTVWLDESCGVVVTADRRVTDWWQGGDAATVIDLETWQEARERAGSPAAAVIDAWESRPTESWEAVVELQPGSVIGETLPNAPPRAVPGVEAAVATAPPVSDLPESAPTKLPTAEPAPPVSAARSSADLAEPAPIVGRATVESGNVFEPPKRLEETYVAPRYPRFPPGPRVPAKVVLDVTVEEDGTIGAISVRSVSPPARGFDLAAQEAVRKWRYRPATLDGVPVQTRVTVELAFR